MCLRISVLSGGLSGPSSRSGRGGGRGGGGEGDGVSGSGDIGGVSDISGGRVSGRRQRRRFQCLQCTVVHIEAVHFLILLDIFKRRFAAMLLFERILPIKDGISHGPSSFSRESGSHFLKRVSVRGRSTIKKRLQIRKNTQAIMTVRVPCEIY